MSYYGIICILAVICKGCNNTQTVHEHKVEDWKHLEDKLNRFVVNVRAVWGTILDFYAALLRQIEIGKKTWNDDPQVLESAVLTGNILPLEFRSSTKKSLKNQASKSCSWFCYKYQRSKCEEKTSPHSATIRGVVRTVHHICASCLQKDGTQQSHPECSDKCPNKEK
ncbi:unnamed protein product [Mytilus edulis]|uniref:Uncharacterized protein n=1 Tax=Mytilus edulis TaxID=6550 RepID=A0A8S3Q6V0_MYTED|nr:unnamed protein product [Mytilus edulis]